MSTHLNDDQLVEALYGLGTAEQTEHVAGCAACQEKKLQFSALRVAGTKLRPVTDLQLHEQRHAVLAQTGKGMRSWPLTAGALAVGLAVAAVFTYHESPSRTISKAVEQGSDEVDLTELLPVGLSSEAVTAEALAAVPMRGLFETAALETTGDEK